MRSKKVVKNITVSLVLQFITILCGFIVPRMIIGAFGSSVNGVVSSIGQFLGYIVLLESGVGGVVRAALYKPLANNDTDSINGILKATEKFFRIVAYIFVGYLLIVATFFPCLIKNEFDSLYTFALVVIIGISTFVKYYFGITYQILLSADQKQYINSTLEIITTILNTLLVIILIKLGVGIHFVKLGSAFIFFIRPAVLYAYVKRNYKLKKKFPPNNEAIKQRWDGLGHHIAFFLHTNTDVVVLTLFTNVREVSVYSIYFMIVSGMQTLTATFSSGVEAAFGNMLAKDEKETLNKNFRIHELMSFTITTVLFTSTALLILPFIAIYTKGFNDVNYYRPVFAYVLICAEAVYCLRIPYNTIVLAAGHYKQTRNGAFGEAIINIVLSVILVNYLGIVGVAIGTLCAMLFRTIQYAIYLSNNILRRSIWFFIKRVTTSAATILIIVFIITILPSMQISSYSEWCVYAAIVTSVAFVVTSIINAVFYYDDMKYLFLNIKDILKVKTTR